MFTHNVECDFFAQFLFSVNHDFNGTKLNSEKITHDAWRMHANNRFRFSGFQSLLKCKF